jgi:hypothetical protein
MMPRKRRYTRYTLEDTQRALQQQQSQLRVEIVAGSASLNGHRIQVLDQEHNRTYWALLLAKSSEWYAHSLHTYTHGIEVVIVGTHDSCLPVRVLALDSMEWYEPEKTRYEATLTGLASGKSVDRFQRLRKTAYGHRVWIGALIMGRAEARYGLLLVPDSTRYRIEAEVKRLRHRRPGRPLQLWPREAS